MAIIRGLGLDVDETVERLIAGGVCPRYAPGALGAIERVIGQTTPEPVPPTPDGPFDVEAFVRRTTHEIWNWRMFGKVRDYYAPDFKCHTVDNQDYRGQEDTITWYESLIAAFPDAQMHIDDMHWLGNEQQGYRASSRWRLVGTTWATALGLPTRRRVSIMGISQLRIRGGRYVEEWMIFNPIALMPVSPARHISAARRRSRPRTSACFLRSWCPSTERSAVGTCSTSRS